MPKEVVGKKEETFAEISEKGITVNGEPVRLDGLQRPVTPYFGCTPFGLFTTADAPMGAPHLTEGLSCVESREEPERVISFSILEPEDILGQLGTDWTHFSEVMFDRGILETYHLTVNNDVFIAVDEDNLPWALAIDKRGTVAIFSGRGYGDSMQLRCVTQVEFYAGKQPSIRFLNADGESYRISEQGMRHTHETNRGYSSIGIQLQTP